jgi:CarD family transcriptional regulator
MEARSHYQIGAKVVHPNHGAGTVVNIESKNIGTACHRYYVIETHSMEVMVPVGRADVMGLRRVGVLTALRSALTCCATPPDEEEVAQDHRARKAALDEQLKTGSFEHAVHAARLLFFLNTKRPLGIIDRRLYDRAMNMLASELALASGVEIDEAEEEIEGRLGLMMVVEEESLPA